MFCVFTCINIYIREKSSSWSVFLSFCFLLINLLFPNFMRALDFYFYFYFIFVGLDWQYCNSLFKAVTY